MTAYVVDIGHVGRADVALVGGKGASLGELARIAGIVVPDGFVVTTNAARAPGEDVDAAIADAVRRHGEDAAYAVRSSATSEDAPTMSFAGQHDSFLDVVGISAILDAVRRCRTSAFTERAVAYRRRHGLDERDVQMAVVVQRMVPAEVSGVLFTADPLTGNRTVPRIEAVQGLGDALVSGRVDATAYRLADADAERLVAIGRRIEAHFGHPQDIEWCLAGGTFHIVQSRPITTLFPIPAAPDDAHRVYMSVGHQQMMTDAMKALGLSMYRLTAKPVMHEAGGRLFVEVTPMLASPAIRPGFLAMAGRSDPLTRDALHTLLERGFVPAAPSAPAAAPAPAAGPPPPYAPPAPLDADPALVATLIAENEASVAALARALDGKSGPALFDVLLDDVQEMKRVLFDPRSHRVFMTAMDSVVWLNEQLSTWLGDKNVGDLLTHAVPGNVTSEMGLSLLSVADVIRAAPEVVAFLAQVDVEASGCDFLDALSGVPGGRAAREAIDGWLVRYGMRCVGEIDITRPRWSERPATLVPVLLANVRNFAPGEGERRFAQGERDALAKADEVLRRLRALPDGEGKAAETRAHIDRVRTFMGYREYPKYGIVRRFDLYKQALLAEADQLVNRGVIDDREDIFHLAFEELREVVRTGRVDRALLRQRADAHLANQALTPPRVLTSEGECLNGAWRRDDVPPGALVGLAVSAGVIEGRARVVLDVAHADLQPGDVLITTCTDPSWTPVFVSIAALVTEVGGLMTHGAVIAREYGLPAVVGVADATRRIQDGQRVRVHGSDGYVELL